MGHYLVGVIPIILAAKNRISAELSQEIDIHVIVREKPNPMVLQIFEAIGIPLIATEAKVLGRIVQTKPKPVETWLDGKLWHTGGYPMGGLLPEIYEPIQSRFQVDQGSTPEKIFISRKHGRLLENEQEISDLLAAHGFQKCYFELDELPVLRQWQIIAGARDIVAIHGAGMTSMTFNPNGFAQPRGDLSGLRIIELHGAGFFVDFNRRLAAIMNAHWCGVRGRITPQIVRDLDERDKRQAHHQSSFHIDPKTLEMALKYSASSRSPKAMAVACN
jgi:hypothetical protein